MEINREEFLKIARGLSLANDIAQAADFEFEEDEERDDYYSELVEIADALEIAEKYL